MYWQDAPDYRTSRTLDWMNDVCEARLAKNDRDNGKVTYAALMSPASVAVSFRDTCGRAQCTKWHTLCRAWQSRKYWGRASYLNRFPISLLLTAEPANPAAAAPYLLLGAKKRVGRRAGVSRLERADISCVPAGPNADPLQCLLRLPGNRDGDIEIRFWTTDEADFLRSWLP